MSINSAMYMKSVLGTDAILYDGKAQIAFIGRSNVGKSSVINAVVNKKGMARSSSRPGKTISLDFFLINNTFYFVDLPGYGYAHASFEQRESFRKMILWYIEYSNVPHRFIVLVLDAKVGITDFDGQIIDLLIKQQIEFVIVANKIDKLKAGEQIAALKKIRSESRNSVVIPFHALGVEGKNELMKTILDAASAALTP